MSRTITREEYDRLREHDYAGPGRPLDPNADGVWWLTNEAGATVLVLGELEGEAQRAGRIMVQTVVCPDCERGLIVPAGRCEMCGLDWDELEAAAAWLERLS